MKRHLLSDVPVGLLLSGGVDSGLLLALMNLYGDVVADLHGRLRLGVRGRRAGRRTGHGLADGFRAYPGAS